MTSPRLKTFYRQLKTTVAPRLESAGFAYDRKRTFRRVLSGEIPVCQIVEFQIGIKSVTGKFMVNLGVYANAFRPGDWPDPGEAPNSWNCLPGKRCRLSRFYLPKRSLIWRILRIPFSLQEHWWPQAEKETAMVATFDEVAALILGDGMAWLNEHATITSLRAAYDELATRRTTLSWDDGRIDDPMSKGKQ